MGENAWKGKFVLLWLLIDSVKPCIFGGMKPSDETIEEFRKNYLEEFREEISKQEAYDKFLRLVNLLRAILHPRYKEGESRKVSKGN
ncbi:MAG: hypothetical protein ABII89_06650 [Candidatus Omnitrophota bacterium]